MEQSSLQSIIVLILILTGQYYLIIGIFAFKQDVKSRIRQDYMLSKFCLYIWSTSYAIMTVSSTHDCMFVFWSIGYTGSCFFFATWLVFLAHLTELKYFYNKKNIIFLYIITLVVCVLGITSGEVSFVKTEYGSQFLYNDSLIFKISFIYNTMLIVFFYIIQLLWLFGSKFRRHKKQAVIFTILTIVITPFGLVFDFVMPTFSDFTFSPLTTVFILIIAIRFSILLEKNKSLNITAENASDIIFKLIEIPIFFLSNRDSIVLANNSTIDLLGKISRNIKNKNIYDILCTNNNNIDRNLFSNCFSHNLINLNISGENKIYDVSLDIKKDDYGDVFSKIVIFRDITDIHNALDRAMEASRAKGDFLSRMSHEMRTPLNAIIGMAKIGIDSNDNDKMYYCLGKINASSRHLLALINDILDMSKIESGKIEINVEKFKLNNKIEEIINVVSVKSEEKDIDFMVDIDSSIPDELIGDSLRLSQVITNLLSNAVKFTPEKGAIHLDIKLDTRINEHESIIYVEVSDTGIGIQSDRMEKLFHAFEQVDGSIARRFGGTGLGLAISKKIVEMMGGQIGVSSEFEKGSRFFFTIPVKHEHPIDQHPLPDPLIYKDIRVLVVDDSSEVRDYFSRFMGKLGVSCDLFDNGSAAVESIKKSTLQDKCNIVFVDHLVNKLGGIEIIREIKNISESVIGVVMVPILKWSLMEKESAQSGVDKFIQKPLISASIVKLINNIINIDEHYKNIEHDNQGSLKDIFKYNHVLLVEDIELNREIVQALLEETGVAMDFAEDGRKALHVFMEHPAKYDLILMDMQMPVMDGLEATREIRSLNLPRAKTIPIVAMTANAFKEDVDACLKSGMNDHIGKPIDFALLIEKMTKYLALTHPGEE